jgi:hypothetical protein
MQVGGSRSHGRHNVLNNKHCGAHYDRKHRHHMVRKSALAYLKGSCNFIVLR